MTIDFDPSQHSGERCQGMLSQLVTPRPIAMISTVGADGTVNVAPYSYYLPITGDPMLIGVTLGAHRQAGGAAKDTWTNVERTGELVVNVTTDSMRDHIEVAAMELPSDVSELSVTGWTTKPSVKVDAPSLVESPAHLECVVRQVIDLGGRASLYSAVHFVIAEVVWVTLDDSICSADHRIDPTTLGTVGRHGFPWFVRSLPEAMFTLDRVPYAEYAARG